MLNRRDFILGSAAALGLPVVPWGSSKAEAAVTLGAVSAAFSLASGVMGFMSRGSNPTVPLLISIAEAVDALGLKITAIDQKLDVMLEEIFAIRRVVEALPYQTNLLAASVDLREPYAAFLELQPSSQVQNPSQAYLKAIPAIRNRMRTARIRYLDLAESQGAPGFEAVVQLALAQDAELLLAAEMQRPEMHLLGLAEDIRGTLGALEAYGRFFDKAVDPKQTGSLTALKAAIETRATAIVKQTIELGSGGLTDAWGGIVPARSAPLERLLEAGHASSICGNDGSRLCLQTGKGRGGCAEPGNRKYYDLEIFIKTQDFPSQVIGVKDGLQRPVLYETQSDMICGSMGNIERSTHKDSIDNGVIALNLEVANYYKIHYAHGVCELARNLNASQQRILRDLI